MAMRYSKEFREEAVRLVMESESCLVEVAKDLGVNKWTLRDWVRNHRDRSVTDRPIKPETLEEENRRLKREVTLLRQERDLLKKAAAYFAKEQM